MSRTSTVNEVQGQTTAIGRWFRDRGVRETVESILVAVLLALLFRTFEAEAYIIPTGSMATNLQGRHIDLVCPQCDYRYRSGASSENPTQQVQTPVVSVVCPICQYELTLKRSERRDHNSFSGDRILVNKYAYDFSDPERWDVIVFKYPNNGKQNYIKRLVGLPGESMLIEYGDIFTFDHDTESFADRRIARKPPYKLLAMMNTVDDTNHVAPALREVKWPSRWEQWTDTAGEGNWSIEWNSNKPTFEIDGRSSALRWLRYRHLIPRRSDWKFINRGELPERYADGNLPAGELITDYYAYNDKKLRGSRMGFGMSGLHWAGDLGVQMNADIQSDTGKLLLDIVEGGVHFTCTIDVKSGEAELSASSDAVTFVGDDGAEMQGNPKVQTSMQGQGRREIIFANADDQLYLWIDGKYVEINGSKYRRDGDVLPIWSESDPGDAEPIGIGSQGLALKISRLRVLRDLYYTSTNGDVDSGFPNLEYKDEYMVGGLNGIRYILRNPSSWQTAEARNLCTKARQRDESYLFRLEEGQYFPMGDNSPESKDARVWEGNRYVDQSYLLGKALFIYWPHAKTKPIPFFPNFERMKFIR